MNDRIKQLRKKEGLTQTEFGQRIGVKGNTITGYETELRTPSDAIIKAISREFGVSEEWMRTGEMCINEMRVKVSNIMINERIRAVRKDVGLTQEQFAKQIGITGSALSLIESGKTNPSNQTVFLICKEFGVREEWLRTGEEPMNAPCEYEDAAYVKELLTDHESPFYDLIRDVMRTYLELSAQDQDSVKRFATAFKGKVRLRE